MTKRWTDDDFMLASRADCKSDGTDEADCDGPLVLLPPQAAISVEIAANGDVLLRQECTLGGDPDQIVIARANLSAFLEALIDLTPHGRCWFNLGGVPPEWSAEPVAAPPPRQPSMPSATPTSAALRQRRHRAIKRAAVPGEPSANH